MQVGQILQQSQHTVTSITIDKFMMKLTEQLNVEYVADIVDRSFKKIAPFWPLKSLVAVNPLQGLEDLSVEEALKSASIYFEQKAIPRQMEGVNRETIKWLQFYLDEGQATIKMPLKKSGLYNAWKKLAFHDSSLHKDDKQKKAWLEALPQCSAEAIAQSLIRLSISKEDHQIFLTLLLTNLPGFASYIKYKGHWEGDGTENSLLQQDYLAIRLVITTLLWEDAEQLISWYKNAYENYSATDSPLSRLEKTERCYTESLLRSLSEKKPSTIQKPEAQFIFCIDVRSEPFRAALEKTANYQTFGFAGFFGLPIQINDTVTKESYASCPVLLKPQHQISRSACSDKGCETDCKDYSRLTLIKKLYQSVKYTFTTPFVLAEAIGLLSGIWIALKSFNPLMAYGLKKRVLKSIYNREPTTLSIDTISFEQQYEYAKKALTMIGLTDCFAPIVIFCGHGSTTENNAYKTALDCGACGGRHGGDNAKVLAQILNRKEIKERLIEEGFNLNKETLFIAAKHNTTTDEVTLYCQSETAAIIKIKQNLKKAQETNTTLRIKDLEKNLDPSKSGINALRRSHDWAQVRPEWGLARNAAFIVGPREAFSSIDLKGRAFLHSYDYKKDPNGDYLTTILTAPMVVAQWINAQYLFSTLNNVSYGAGSKITKNITGKIAVMQGNSSDLMTGLPLQSVFADDLTAYHEPQRLISVVFATKKTISTIIEKQPVLQKLFGNGWVQLACIDPTDEKTYLLNRELIWEESILNSPTEIVV